MDPTAARRAQQPGGGLCTGLLGMGYDDLYIFLIPLYALSLGMSASEVGRWRGAPSARPLLSIHVGVLMDRFGTRRVTLFFVWTAIALSPLFPLVPSFWPLMLLQIVNGGALSFGWSGSQTLIAQLRPTAMPSILDASISSHGSARRSHRSSSARRGDIGGAWPAYLIGVAWGCC